ncbi:hypothetical protein N9B82_03350 [Saprospiraceae bacterium]|nr:hypothetical protein [Saprospiraceae bacterium]
MSIQRKLGFIIFALNYFVWSYPIRIYRVVKKVLVILKNLLSFRYTVKVFLEDVFGWSLLIGDLLGIPELYDSTMLLLKPSTRNLNAEELEIASDIIGDSIPLYLIKIDDKVNFLAKKGRFAYVSFFTINLYGKLRSDTFVHELIHVWQYTRFGSEYIAKALFAQHSHEGYDYGGAKGITEAYIKNNNILDFNFEQQGDILSDYFINKYKESIKGSSLQFQREKIYSHFVDQIKELKIYRW